MNVQLTKKISDLIRKNGPITIEEYFSLCLSDVDYGYYKTCDPFGISGDFVTAPEINQIFGEMLAIFFICAWEEHGFPKCIRLIEMGPGRGTMMTDMLRTILKLKPVFFSALSVHMIEDSERLRSLQKQQLSSYIDKISWHEDLDTVPLGFSFFIANEFFDSLPIRQFVVTTEGIRERMINVDHHDALFFCVGDSEIDQDLLPRIRFSLGMILETSSDRDYKMALISKRLSGEGGTAVIIDYGHLQTSAGDTLQAVKGHRYDPPLLHPGKADLTSHVDFQKLALIAISYKLYINGYTTQGRFLEGLGIWHRVAAFTRNPIQRETFLSAVRRLVGTDSDKKSMGELFKVMVVSHQKVDLMPFIDFGDI
ncbi:class I SAM-dependent methyltransferase [Candidatus Liberibacter sp.]|uniref:class I SAM-dependent methyltransferase n=1 Tax=Candidatus Liberibacter sp. TaxID=34022 RepID=UPI0015F5B8C1|nr:SAM-dependent methyltransferase [Candidatus Liberibacter sp.]MBA5724414.1 SAM-dependent methyltransferase [Candidatus Liberibacter sp.]